jgi:AraC-like DNA-binding protein
VVSYAPDVNADSADAQFLGRVTDALDTNLSDADFTVDALAGAVGLSPQQLQRRLKDLTGMTARPSCAGTVSEIACQVGFGMPETFRKHFRDRFGHPPSEHA